MVEATKYIQTKALALEAVNGKGAYNIINASSLVPNLYDYIELTYTGSNPTTVVYKTGGASGTTVATLTLTYVSDNVTSVTRS